MNTASTEVTLVPRLRLPEFSDSWASTTFADAATVKHGFAFKGEYFADTGPYVVLTPGNFSPNGGFRYQGDKEKYYSDTDFPQDYILDKGDLLVVMTEQAVGLIGCPLIVPENSKFLHNQRLGLLQATNRAHKPFLFHYLQTRDMRIAFSITGAGTKVRHTSPKKIEKLPVTLPSIPEQQKIADFLTTVDGRIQQLSQKKALLQDYKKGVMQQLFTQALRFKDDHGNDFPDWEEKKLGDVTTLIAGFAFGSEFFAAHGRKLITPKNFTKSGRASFTEQNTKYTTEDVPERFQCRSGDLLVLLTDLTPTCELLGSPARLRDDDGIVLLNQRIVRLSPDVRHVSAGYLTYFLQTSAYRKRIIETATGSTVRHSSNKILLGTDLPLPSLPEQTKIANFLTALNRKIESVSQQITHTQTFKRGLLQQMFV